MGEGVEVAGFRLHEFAALHVGVLIGFAGLSGNDLAGQRVEVFSARDALTAVLALGEDGGEFGGCRHTHADAAPFVGALLAVVDNRGHDFAFAALLAPIACMAFLN